MTSKKKLTSSRTERPRQRPGRSGTHPLPRPPSWRNAIADQDTPPRGRLARLAAACALPLLGLAVLTAATITVVRLPSIPPQHLPFARLDLERPLGLATGWQLAALRKDPSLCRGVIEMSALQVTTLPSRRSGSFCGLLNAVEIRRSTVPYSAPVRLTCPMAAALYLWEREVVAPAAAHHLGGRVVRIDHLGTYSCRRIGGGPTGRPSQHATANAIDIAGFRLADGRRVTLSGGWNGTPQEQAFLREIRDGACDLFRGVLGPDYNAAHRDHFHLDMGAFGVCR